MGLGKRLPWYTTPWKYPGACNITVRHVAIVAWLCTADNVVTLRLALKYVMTLGM